MHLSDIILEFKDMPFTGQENLLGSIRSSRFITKKTSKKAKKQAKSKVNKQEKAKTKAEELLAKLSPADRKLLLGG